MSSLETNEVDDITSCERTTYHVRILDLSLDTQLVPPHDRNDGLCLNHAITFLLAEKLVIAFHYPVEASPMASSVASALARRGA